MAKPAELPIISDHFFESRFDTQETGRRLTSFLHSEQSNPGGEFSGRVEMGWVYVQSKTASSFGFCFRGAISPARTGRHAVVDLLITPKTLTMLVLLPVAIATFLSFVFLVVMLQATYGFAEGRFYMKALVIALMLSGAVILAIALIVPRRDRRRLIEKLRFAGIAT